MINFIFMLMLYFIKNKIGENYWFKSCVKEFVWTSGILKKDCIWVLLTCQFASRKIFT